MSRLIAMSVVIIGLSGMSFLVASGVTAEAAETKSARLRKLGLERVAVLKEIHEKTRSLYRSGDCGFSDAHIANVEYMRAVLDVAQTDKERLSLLQELLRESENWEKIATKLNDNGQRSHLDVLRSRADTLDCRIALEKVQSKE